VTNSSGGVVSTIELDPWGADTSVSSGAAFQPKKFTSYHRDDNGTDEAMFRRYNRWHSRFDQPDPHDGSYDFSDPQSFNRYAYVQNDPASFVDPTGLEMSVCGIEQNWEQCVGSSGWGDTFYGNTYAGGNGWGHDPHPGRRDIRNAEPIFTFRRRGRDLELLWEWTVSSMFDEWEPWGPQTPAERLNAALTELKGRLEANGGDNPCAKFFGGLKNAQKKLNELMKSHRFGPTEPGAAAEVSPKGVLTIDPQGPFMDTTNKVDIHVSTKGAYITLGSIQAAAFFLAHELGHKTNKLINDSTAYSGSLAKQMSWANSGMIRDNCFSEAQVNAPK
jgi:RHS repeat-associated protein